jgi:hypothetical protein
MFDYRLTVVAPLSHREPHAYSMSPRTVPTFVSRFTNARPPAPNGTTPRAEDLGLIDGAHSGAHALRKALNDSGATNQEVRQLSHPSRYSDA